MVNVCTRVLKPRSYTALLESNLKEARLQGFSNDSPRGASKLAPRQGRRFYGEMLKPIKGEENG